MYAHKSILRLEEYIFKLIVRHPTDQAHGRPRQVGPTY
jgi:hypothetical protein